MSSTAKKRPVPHINLTPELQAAIQAYSAGAPPGQLVNPGDAALVRDAMARVAHSFEDPAFFYTDEAATEIAAIDHLILLATLHREHLKSSKETVF